MAFLKLWAVLLLVFALTQNIDSTTTTTTTTTAATKATAPTTTTTTTTTKKPHPGPQDPKCLQPKETGPCHMNLMRYYYNPETNACEEFKFGGCKGNENKFGFKETCEKACKKSTEPSNSGAKTSATVEGHKAQSSTHKPELLNTHKSEGLHAAGTEKSTSTTTTSKTVTSTTAPSKSKTH
uniref:BPTI/Kunitz inhibitor domain-containing protein n=1 Tax=Glossina austeni TaxID=7395 RepID=A0A1A9V0W4_GLOAU